jgi:prepilin-type N-terminal cleavage/methylation domain-containing protein
MMLVLPQRHGLQLQRGFTLIELLVVLAILAILAAIVTFGVVTFLNNANRSACLQEKSTVQTAMDAMMASTQITAMDTHTTPNIGNPIGPTDWRYFPQGSNVAPLYSVTTANSYLRSQTTKWQYGWDGYGKIVATSAVNGITC